MKQRPALALFNRGRISPLALARTDVGRVQLSAEEQTNWMPRRLGSMMLRPGMEYIGASRNAVLIPFVYSSADTAMIEISATGLRFWDDGTDLVTRPGVSATIANQFFLADLSGWTDADESGATSEWDSDGFMKLTGTGYNAAIRQHELSITPGEESTVHSLRVIVERGPVEFAIGTFAGGDDVFELSTLNTGNHSLAFVPGDSTVYIEFSSRKKYPVLVQRCQIESAGTLAFTSGTFYSQDELDLIRWHQVNDVIFLACDGVRQRRIERRANNSWSLTEYETEDGPFLIENLGNVRLTPSANTGEITLTASQRVFRVGHIGALFQLTSTGQLVTAALAAESTYSSEIRITGVGDQREFLLTISGTWSGTLTLQRSIGEPGGWIDYAEYTSNTTDTITGGEGLDNAVVYYRIGFNSGDYSSGTANVELEFAGGSITGTVRIIDRASAKSATAVVLQDLGGNTATERWAEGAWSDYRGYPSAVSMYEGRLWWAGRGKIWGSVSDNFESFDPDYEGDAGPINRFLGDGPVDIVNWIVPGQRLIAGTDAGEISVRSTSFDEPITPTNYNAKYASTYGSAPVPGLPIDKRVVFVDRSKRQVFEMDYSVEANDYAPVDLTALVPEIGEGNFRRIAVQRRPDTRIHAVREDGTVAVLVRDKAEDVLCWVDVETDGEVIDACVLPGTSEDRVYYLVKRTLQLDDVYCLERWALESECQGGALNKQADSYVYGEDVSATATLSGLDHLNGETVAVWADGGYRGEFQVVDGAVTLSSEVTNWVAGLPYTARFKSARIAADTRIGSGLSQRQRVDHIGLILSSTHWRGIEYGPDFDVMDNLPYDSGLDMDLFIGSDGILLSDDDGVYLSPDSDNDTLWSQFGEDMIEFPGDWSTDSRICLRATAPKPCTVLAAVISIDKQDKA